MPGMVDGLLSLPIPDGQLHGRIMRETIGVVLGGIAQGSENQNLPAFVAIPDPRGVPQIGPRHWGSAFLPAAFQGTAFNAQKPIPNLARPDAIGERTEMATRDFLRRLNDRHLAQHPGDSELAARISAYELAARMQLAAAEISDLSRESPATQELYGVNDTNANKALGGAEFYWAGDVRVGERRHLDGRAVGAAADELRAAGGEVSRADAARKRWLAHLVIPFSTLGVETPANCITWKANFGRNHALPRETIDRAIWSSSLTSTNMDDTAVMGEIVFE